MNESVSQSKPFRILLIAYRFPPQGGGGVQRPSKMVKAWTRRGAEVAVLTGPEDVSSLKDPSLLKDIPDSVERVSVPDPGLYPWLQRKKHGVPSILRRIFQFFLWIINHCSVPDLGAGWYFPAFRKGRELARRFEPDVIYVTGPPWTPSLVAMRLSKALDIPMVIDYRDPWMRSYLGLSRGFLASCLNPGIETRVLRQSAGVVAAHREILRKIADVVPKDTLRIWIPNGCDLEDFPPFESKTLSEEVFTLGYTGGFFRWRAPTTLYRAIESLIDSGEIDSNRFRFHMAGSVGPALDLCSPGSRLRDLIEVKGYLPHEESIRLLQSSTANLVIEADQGGRNHHTPGKFYEVLHAKRPVLLLCPEGVTTQLARKIGGCKVAHPEDAEAIRAALLDLYRQWSVGMALDRPDEQHSRFYDRIHQGCRALEFMKRAVDRKNRQSPLH